MRGITNMRSSISGIRINICLATLTVLKRLPIPTATLYRILQAILRVRLGLLSRRDEAISESKSAGAMQYGTVCATS